MRQLEESKKIEIIEKRLEGESFDQIAGDLKISKSTAFKVWNEFESGKAFYIANRDAYLLSKELTDIAKTMKEKGMGASDFLEVYALWELMHRLKLDMSKGIEYLNVLERASDPESIVSTITGIFESAENRNLDPKMIMNFLIDNFEKQEKLKKEINDIKNELDRLKSEKKNLNGMIKKYRAMLQNYESEIYILKYLKRRYKGKTEDIMKLFRHIGKEGFKLEMVPDLLEINNIMHRQNIKGRDLEEIVLNIKTLINHGITPEGIKRMGKNLGNSSVADVYDSMVYLLSHRQEIIQELQDLKNEKEDLIREKSRLNSDIETIKENIESAKDKEIAELTNLTSLRNEVNNEKLILSMIEKKRKEQEAWLDFLMKLNPKVPDDIETYLQLLRKIAEKKRELRDLEQNLRDLEELQKNLTILMKDLGLNMGDCMKVREMLEKNKEIIDELPEITEKIKKLMALGQLKKEKVRVFKMPSFQKESDKKEKA
jgi:chromosome segregation ATPase